MKKMIIRIIPRVEGEGSYPDTINIVSKKSEFCCSMLKDEYITSWGYDSTILRFSPDYIELSGVDCKYCPYCGTKIHTKLIKTGYEKRYQEEVRKEEKAREEYLKNLKPMSKYKVRKMKKTALSDYENVFQQRLQSQSK